MRGESGDAGYLEVGQRLRSFVRGTQEAKGKSAALAGAMSGSYPFGGEDGPWRALNRATKFFAHSLTDYLEAVPSDRAWA